MANEPTPERAEIEARLQEERSEWNLRYQLRDPFAETTFHFATASQAIAKADEMGATRFQHISAAQSSSQVDKVDGQWFVRGQPTPPDRSQEPPGANDRPLSEVQADEDRAALRAIEERAQQRAELDRESSEETDKTMAEVDAFAFRRIEDAKLQERAAIAMAMNARAFPNYKSGLDAAIPGTPGTADRVYTLAAAHQAEDAALAGAAGEKAAPGQAQRVQPDDNTVQSNEIFTAAERELYVIPDDLKGQFLKVGTKGHWHYAKSPDSLAFVDGGNKLKTESNSVYMAETLVRIAIARGWDEVKVTGSDNFKREVWLQAAQRGMSVRGYTPTDVDRAKLAELKGHLPINTDSRANLFASGLSRAALKARPELAGAFAAANLARATMEKAGLGKEEISTAMGEFNTQMQQKLSEGKLPVVRKTERVTGLAGTLVAHGAARYQHKDDEAESYYVRVRTDDGEKTLWGLDLERAVKEGGVMLGQAALFERTGTSSKEVIVPVRDSSGGIMGSKPVVATRNTWKASPLDSQTEVKAAEEKDRQKQKELER